jgi:hypothetical protein
MKAVRTPALSRAGVCASTSAHHCSVLGSCDVAAQEQESDERIWRFPADANEAH